MIINNEQTQALQAAAEKATKGDWWIDSHGGAMVSFSDKDDMEVIFVTDGLKMGPATRHEDTGNLSHWRNDNDATFIATANPAVILSLLAERDADKALIAELEKKHCGGSLMEREEHHVGVVNKLLERITELEARTLTVKLPKPHAHLIWIQAGYPPDDYWDDVAVSHSVKDRCCDGSERYPVYSIFEIQEACTAVGITLVVGE